MTNTVVVQVFETAAPDEDSTTKYGWRVRSDVAVFNAATNLNGVLAAANEAGYQLITATVYTEPVAHKWTRYLSTLVRHTLYFRVG